MNFMLKKITQVTGVVLMLSHLVQAQTLDQTAQGKVAELQLLIDQADSQGLDTSKEKMAVSTAELFLGYANWDEANYSEVLYAFQKNYWYNRNGNPAQLATDLPDQERQEVIDFLDDSITDLTDIIAGTYVRAPSIALDYTGINIVADQLVKNGKPIFTHDYMMARDAILPLAQYHGDYNGHYMQPGDVINSTGTIGQNEINECNGETAGGKIGHVWIDHRWLPSWVTTMDPTITDAHSLFMGYDTDNPTARAMIGYLLDGTVPLLKGKSCTKLGYMLVNEPHWNTVAGYWDTYSVSDLTKEKFKVWLSNKHATIGDMNALWGTGFSSFNDVTISIPISEAHQGTPMWYDWLCFNQWRGTDWFQFMADKIRSNDADAPIHVKVMPEYFAENQRGQGLDFEAITRLSDISGNDAYGHYYNPYRTKDDYDKTRYCCYVRETVLSYDFFQSVRPEQIIYNSEMHYDSYDTNLRRDWTRMMYWLAHMHGLNAGNTWGWFREADNSIRDDNDTFYGWFPGTYSQAAGAVYEMASTYLDLNSHSELIADMQHQEKPLRIFYSETSAIIKTTHMDDVFEMYEELYFDGLSLGFATKGIIEELDNSTWEAILVHKTEFVRQEELDALQAYLNNGGTVIVDNVSLKMDEYGRPLPALTPGSGILIQVPGAANIRTTALGLLSGTGLLPEVSLSETNTGTGKGCTWKTVKDINGDHIVSIVNIGATEATLNLSLSNDTIHSVANMLDGRPLGTTLNLPPFGTLFLRIRDGSSFATPLWSDYVAKYALSGVQTNHSDADPMTDWAEYVFDGNPTNSADVGMRPLFDAETGDYIFRIRNDTTLVARILTNDSLTNSAWTTNETVNIHVHDGSMATNSTFLGTLDPQLFIKMMVDDTTVGSTQPPGGGTTNVMISGSTGNGNFNAVADGSGTLPFSSSPSWFNASGAESADFTSTGVMAGSSDSPNTTPGAISTRDVVQVNSSGHTVAAAGETFSLNYEFGASGGPSGWDGSTSHRTFLFTANAPVDANLTTANITEIAANMHVLNVAIQGQWTTPIFNNFYTTVEGDIGKTFYFGMEFQDSDGSNNGTGGRIDVIELEVDF